MSLFTQHRLTNHTFNLDLDGLRRGHYSDKYFVNITSTLTQLAAQKYQFSGQAGHLRSLEIDVSQIPIGDIEVEMQWFTRREPKALIVGVDKALSILRHGTGYFETRGEFVETWSDLDVDAVQDGVMTNYTGDVTKVQPVLRVRGRYRDFANLETATLGVLTRGSRVATNVYNTLVAAQGKPILFFPARFDAHEVQALDGYAYDIAVKRYNLDYAAQSPSIVSTDAQGAWWQGSGGGTVAHAAIASFLGDTVETMLAFAATHPASTPRVALVDFHNDCVGTSLAVMQALFARYQAALTHKDEAEAEKYRLFGVRLDTSGSMRDVSLEPLGDKQLDNGVNPRLVWTVRQALDQAWQSWDLAPQWREIAAAYCRAVKIVVSGGFAIPKIRQFESLKVPVDMYGIGSSLMSNDDALGTNTDFTADVVRVKMGQKWVDLAKIGRCACDNPDLQRVDLADL